MKFVKLAVAVRSSPAGSTRLTLRLKHHCKGTQGRSAVMSTAASHASLLGVSAEIRLTIYKHVFEDSIIHIHFHRNQSEPTRIRIHEYHSAITRVSHQLRHESFPVLCRDTTIHICDTAGTYLSSCSATDRIPRHHLEYARRIETDEITKLNHELPLKCPNLEQLTLTRCCRPLLPRDSPEIFATKAARDEVLSHAFSNEIRDGRFQNGIGVLQNATWSKSVTVQCEVYFDDLPDISDYEVLVCASDKHSRS